MARCLGLTCSSCGLASEAKGHVHIRQLVQLVLSSQGNLLGMALQDAADRSSATFRQGYFDAALIKVHSLVCHECDTRRPVCPESSLYQLSS